MQSPDGRFVLVFNGEIYNYEELRRQYFPGRHWAGHGDTEVLLALLSAHGITAVNELNGDFAFAFLDTHRARLWLCRDRFGIKPMYYSSQGGELIFGSEIKALKAAGLKADCDPDLLGAYLTFKFVPGNDTFFRGIRRLPPAHWMEVDLEKGTTSLHRYWELPQAETSTDGFRETALQLRHLIDDAVHIRLVSDRPVGTFLSGGLDSSIIASSLRGRSDVAHYVATKSAGDLRVEGSTSDHHYAHLLADRWGLTLHDIPIGGGELSREMLQEIVRNGDDLIADGSQVPAWLICQGASEHSRVLLSGMGADELFFGYHWHQLTWLDARLGALPGGLDRWLARRLAKLQAGKGHFRAYKRYLQKLGRHYGDGPLRYGQYALVGGSGGALHLAPGGDKVVEALLEKHFPEGADPWTALMHFDLAHFLHKNLAYTDRMAMAHGVEVRVPFLDHRVAELAARIPPHWKLGPMGRPKHILKEAYRDVLPKEVLNRRKAGFGMPLRSIFSDRSAVEALLDRQRLGRVPGLDLKALEGLIDRHIRGEEDHSALIFAVVMLGVAE